MSLISWNVTAEQISESLLAVPAFLPVTVSTGYLAAWFTNLHNFRQRSMVERLFWSVPLSFAVSTITAVLIGKFLSLNAVVAFFLASALLWIVTLAKEWLQLRRRSTSWVFGWKPMGGKALILAALWIAVVVSSLVDIQRDQRLLMSAAMADHGARINWTESVLRTGVPPTNSLYLYKRPEMMRNYYFWYVICASVARLAHLPVRAVFIASCVWGGFALAALTGIYLKHFLDAGIRLRRMFLYSVSLFMVTGLGIVVALWDIFYLHRSPLSDLEGWTSDTIPSWLQTLLFAPHHIVSLVCCMFAFLLAWTAGRDSWRRRTASVALIACALASSFGLSIYVTFAFFLVAVVWAAWQVAVEREPLPVLFLGAGGLGAILLLLPYLRDLMQTPSTMHGGSAFGFAIRSMSSPDGLLASRLFSGLAASHPILATNLAQLILLAPAYASKLGFFFVVLLIWLFPAWRGRKSLTPAQRSLLVISVATIPFVSFLRSGSLETNDFGWRGTLLLQFPLLLLGCEEISRWALDGSRQSASAHKAESRGNIPQWLRSVAAVTVIIGAVTTFSQALLLRFSVPIAEHTMIADGTFATRNYSHNAYISSIGYTQLDRTIPMNAVVQFNPNHENPFATFVDMLGVDRQVAIVGDRPSCGSELGGDPSGCPVMASAIDALYNGATAEQARATCNQYGIQYLIARIYDPAWHDKSSWIWTLKPVVSDEEFRALDCNQ